MAENYRKYFDPRALAKLRGLHLRARQIAEGYVAGLHRSPYPGYSIEFSDHRNYSPGDDLRYVDWKVFGRTDKFYLKQFEDETNLVCHLVVDASESMRYRGPAAPLSKFEYAQCAAAALAGLILRQQDAVGLATFDSQVRHLLRPSSTASRYRDILDTLENTQPSGETALGPILHELAERFRRRGLVILLSDLFDTSPSLLAGLKHFHHRRHDVIVLQVLDPAELDFPFAQPTLFRGLESLPEVRADPRAVRSAYLRHLRDHIGQIREACRSQQFDYALLRTDAPLDTVLSSFLSRRMARVR